MKEKLEALIEEAGDVVIIGATREEFQDAEVGLSFEGKMIYSRAKLVEILPPTTCR